jgi:4-alpha-glucanotransferase
MYPLQDVLNLGMEARMNLPGRVEGNWHWRFTEDVLSEPVLQRLHELTATSNRHASLRTPVWWKHRSGSEAASF